MKALKVGSNQAGGSYKVEWLVTIKGISKKVTTDVLVNQNGNSIYILTVFQLNRLDWKVGGNGILMSDKVIVSVSANLLR
jgi:polyisoprenoid-binding protein YceI